ncbi:MAG: DUF2279 domain-containing protein [bacterium]
MISKKNANLLLLNILLLAFLLSTNKTMFAQDSTEVVDSTEISHSFWSKYNMSKYAAGGMALGTLGYAYGVWWKNDFRSFRFFQEGQGVFDAHLAIDKIGHFYTSYFMFHSIDEILKWGGHDKDEALWWAAGVSAFHAFAIEVGDGLSEYGFDPEDLIWNWSGVGYSMLQEKVPFFKNFQFKWSLYYPLSKHAFKVNDLYDYHIYFISAKVNNLLPEQMEKYWPDFLQIALGYSGRNNVTEREFILSFDYDLELIPIEGDFAALLKSIFNMFHLPAPGVKFSPGHKPEFQLLLLN